MKKLSVLILVAILGIVFWALPAGAEKIRLSDAELDGITASGVPIPCGQVCVPPPNSVSGIVLAGILAQGGLMGGPHGLFAAGGATPLAKGVSASITAIGHLSSPTGSFEIVTTSPAGGFCIHFGTGSCF